MHHAFILYGVSKRFFLLMDDFDQLSFLKLKDNVDRIQKDLFGLQGIKRFVKEPTIEEVNSYLVFSVKQTQSVLDKFSI
jgi:hypothetical protein